MPSRSCWRLHRASATNVGVAELTRRLESLAKGTTRNPPNGQKAAHWRSGARLSRCGRRAVVGTVALPNVRVHRPAIPTGAQRRSEKPRRGLSLLAEAAWRVREENGCWAPAAKKRAVGSTLLLKGLEAEVAVLLNVEDMSAQNLYVAVTRGSMKPQCSASPVIG